MGYDAYGTICFGIPIPNGVKNDEFHEEKYWSFQGNYPFVIVHTGDGRGDMPAALVGLREFHWENGADNLQLVEFKRIPNESDIAFLKEECESIGFTGEPAWYLSAKYT